jgi:hypothetical protein
VGRLLRRLLPWLVGATILAIVVSQVPFGALRGAIGQGPHLALAAVVLAVVGVTLGTDAVATWVGLIGLRMPRPLAHVAAVRGATFILFLINFALGHGGFGYYLHRTGASAAHAAGATLFLVGTNLAALLIVTSIAWTVHGGDGSLGWILAAGCAALLTYLVVIALSPAWLARRAVFAPLVRAGVRGHAIAIAARLPHVLVMSLGIWIAIRVWGIDVPFSAGVTLMPIVVVINALPIAPAGLGTTQAALVFFFSGYAAGSDPGERSAALVAFSIVHFGYALIAICLIGMLCVPIARQVGLLRFGDHVPADPA